MILSFVASAKYGDRSSTIKKLDSAVQGCMDQYSDIPDNVLKEQVKKPVEDGRSAAVILSIFATMVVVKIIIVGFIACCIKMRGKKKRI